MMNFNERCLKFVKVFKKDINVKFLLIEIYKRISVYLEDYN